MLLESPQKWSDYELIDSGEFEKLERFGKYFIIRPEPKALWNRQLSEREWMTMAHTRFTTGAGFGKSGKEDSGSWHQLKKMPEQWLIAYKKGGLDFNLRLGLTAFKHVGVFPEQAPNWDYIYNETLAIAKSNKLSEMAPPKVLNLFAYTGAASLAAKCAGADVTHLDSVRQVVTWARTNMELSNLDNIRWVIEDALKFVIREAKRGNKYQGIIMDPPAYGHGPDGEKWKLDELLYDMMCEISRLMAFKDSYLVLNLYSNGYSALLSETLVKSAFGLNLQKDSGAEIEYGELFLEDRFKRALPLSVFTRMRR
ncbi:MAG: class I SAM-dependent methyltransferase [Bacteroidales bacterium]|jgi:23S rRNA (cytosine1962-C5)-methyltransferase|nr:class I SAM-dependent methyltransferase [Bacteroidales bacterium]